MTRILTTSLFIAMTLIAVAACSGSGGSVAPSAATSQAPAAPAGGATAVTIKDFAFSPATATAAAESRECVSEIAISVSPATSAARPYSWRVGGSPLTTSIWRIGTPCPSALITASLAAKRAARWRPGRDRARA